MTAQESLLPCPFCGGNPTLTKHHREDMWGLIHRCEVVGAVSFDWGAVERHAARWNRRAQPVARTPLTDEQLSKALEDGGVGTQTHIGILNRVSWTTCGSIDPRKICRAIERAHGITQESKQGEQAND